MYINRKTGERVDADWDVKDRKWQIAQTNGILIEVLTDKKFHEQYGEAMICPNKECSQYCECYKATPHICDYACDCSEAMSCPACIPYIPEQKPKKDKLTESFEQMMIDTFNLKFVDVTPSQKQADEEPVFPVCGTCNARKDANACDTQGNLIQYSISGSTKEPKPNLLLSDEEIRELIRVGLSKDWVVMEYSKLLLQNELDHLAKLGIVYVKEEIICKESNKSGKCWIDGEDIEKVCGNDGTCVYREYIPLADYMKGEGK
jgi:hypothetical protein